MGKGKSFKKVLQVVAQKIVKILRKLLKSKSSKSRKSRKSRKAVRPRTLIQKRTIIKPLPLNNAAPIAPVVARSSVVRPQMVPSGTFNENYSTPTMMTHYNQI